MILLCSCVISGKNLNLFVIYLMWFSLLLFILFCNSEVLDPLQGKLLQLFLRCLCFANFSTTCCEIISLQVLITNVINKKWPILFIVCMNSSSVSSPRCFHFFIECAYKPLFKEICSKTVYWTEKNVMLINISYVTVLSNACLFWIHFEWWVLILLCELF